MLVQFQKIASILGVVLTMLSTLTGINVEAIAPVLAKITALANALSSLTPVTNIDTLISDVMTALSGLKSSGVVTGGAADSISEALAALTTFSATVADYKSGQAAIIDDNFSFEGVPGVLLAVSKAGATYQLIINGTADPS